MKNLTQKTDELLEALVYCNLRTDAGTDNAKKLIRLAIEQQDRDTRHACSEEIARMKEDNDDYLIHKAAAHDACMNAKAL